MHVTHRLIALSAVCGLCFGAETAQAQEANIDVDLEAPPPAVTPYDQPREGVVVVRQEAPDARVAAERAVETDDVYADSIFFLEASGATGVQLGDTSYLPSGTPGDWQFPLVYGFGVGGT